MNSQERRVFYTYEHRVRQIDIRIESDPVFSSRCSGLVLVGVGARVVIRVLLAFPAHFPRTNRNVMAMQQLGTCEQRH